MKRACEVSPIRTQTFRPQLHAVHSSAGRPSGPVALDDRPRSLDLSHLTAGFVTKSLPCPSSAVGSLNGSIVNSRKVFSRPPSLATPPH